MNTEFSAKTTTSPNVFFVLHVEDDPDEVKNFRKVAESVLSQTYETSQISWETVGSRREAVEKLNAAEKDRPMRGYDAVFVDLQIPERPGGEVDTKNGIDVLCEVSRFAWVGSSICLSTFASEPEMLQVKESELEDVDIDEWLHKHDDDTDLIYAKLARCLIPVERFTNDLRRHLDGQSPLVFESILMKELLREIVFLARRPYHSWPLAKILLLGPPGSGKGALSRAFHRLLPTTPSKKRAPFVRLNCPSAVSEGHGGRISLFGARSFGDVPDQAGVFEKATYFDKRSDGGLAEDGQSPDATRAGAVFLDEFAELAPDLQASILAAIEDGEIRREGDGSIVNIGCHVIFATNQDVDSLVASPDEMRRIGGRLREDLVDRIPHVLSVPTLADRRDEIYAIITELAASHLRRFDPGRKHKVSITCAASKMIDRAITRGLINSVRQLESIANVLPGETRITDGNLHTLFSKAAAIQQELLLDPAKQVDLTVRQQSLALGLGDSFQQDGLPESTEWSIRRLYAALDNESERIRARELEEDEPIQRVIRVTMLTECLIPSTRDKIFWGTKRNGFTVWRTRLYKKHKLEWLSNRQLMTAAERVRRCVEFLTESTDDLPTGG